MPATKRASTAHHSVYVIRLKPAAAADRDILRQNPHRDPARPCVYVGMTGLPIEKRFENHRDGIQSSRFVRKYHDILMPQLYEHLNPMPWQVAVQKEKDLARELRYQGYTVTGGH